MQRAGERSVKWSFHSCLYAAPLKYRLCNWRAAYPGERYFNSSQRLRACTRVASSNALEYVARGFSIHLECVRQKCISRTRVQERNSYVWFLLPRTGNIGIVFRFSWKNDAFPFLRFATYFYSRKTFRCKIDIKSERENRWEHRWKMKSFYYPDPIVFVASRWSQSVYIRMPLFFVVSTPPRALQFINSWIFHCRLFTLAVSFSFCKFTLI